MAEQAPAAAPVPATQTAPEPVAPGASSQTQAQIDADSADLAKAMEFLKAPAEPAAPVPAVTPAPAPEKPAEKPSEAPAAKEPDQDTKAILARMARLEFEREQAQSELDKLRGVSEPASKWAKIQELKASRDFAGVLTELGVTADELQSMVLDGNKPVDPKVRELEKKAAELAEFQARIVAERQAQETAAAQAQFKSQELAPKLTSELCPLGRQVYGDRIVDEVFAVLQYKYQQGDRNPSIADAAKVVEDYLGNLRVKLVPSPTAEPAKATPVTTTLTNTPATSPRVAPDMDSEDGRFEAALKLLKGN